MLSGVRGGSSLRIPMSHGEYLALGETKHHEYYDGLCVVNPPSRLHVLATMRLTRVLEDHCPAGYVVYMEWGWRAGEGEFQPDVMVAAVDAPSEDQLTVPPLLVVEVTSPSTRHDDWGVKREKYAAAGAPWYWIVEREGIVVLQNVDGAFVEVQRIETGQPATAAGPFPVPLDPDSLFA